MLASTADSTRVVAAAARWDGRGRDAARSGTEHFFLKADLRIAFYLNVLYVMYAVVALAVSNCRH